MRRNRFARVSSLVCSLLLVTTACGGDDEPQPEAEEDTTAPGEPTGAALSPDEIAELAALFPDQPLTGGQEAPRLYRWVNEDVAIFVQFDTGADVAEATALRYVGISVKGVFCAEDQPGGPDGGFPHFHRLDAAEYAEGHGGPPGTPGYWLSWVATDTFESFDGREVTPGVDYEFSPTPEPPTCGSDLPEADFDGPGATELSTEDIEELAGAFGDEVLTGGQEAPRLYRWVNEDVSLFVQSDAGADMAEATALPYIGISVKGEFCADKQPSEDFPHFHRIDAAEYAEGHGQSPGDTGYWLLWLATDTFESFDGREVTPGVDREFSPTPPPAC